MCVREGREAGGWDGRFHLPDQGVTKNYPDPIDHVKGYYQGMKNSFRGTECIFSALSLKPCYFAVLCLHLLNAGMSAGTF